MSESEKKNKNVFVRALRWIFVNNWGLKLTALITAVGLWLLAAGL